jgi:FkbM family methyltransferase
MAELIVDVGMHDAKDTAYYLEKGYDVLAVDANPEFCADASKRFATEIAAGRLTIRNVGIAESPGELTFWVSSQTEWSSFDKDKATRAGTSATAIVVPTVRFADLLSEFPTPLCVKIDIEGNDALCLRELERCSALPAYVSFEATEGAAEDLEFLMKLGFQRFRCIRQNDWREITPDNMLDQGRKRKFVHRASRFGLGRVLRPLHYRKPNTSGWRFKVGSSGPLPNEFAGQWLRSEEVLKVWNHLEAVDFELNAHRLGEWYDFHAFRP